MQTWGVWPGSTNKGSLSSFNPSATLAEYGMPKSCIHGLPGAGEVLFADHPDQQVDFCDRLREKLSEHPHGMRLSNIEISKVAWSHVTLELLFSMFQEKGATTQRVKAFKCALDDEALQVITNWIEATPAEGIPSEIHLSHNQITLEGFNKLVEVLERKYMEMVKKPVPIWLRVEGNKVQDSVLKQLVKEGRAIMCPNCGARNGKAGTVPLAFPGFPDKQPQQAALNPPAWGAASGNAVWWPSTVAAASMPAAPGMAAQGTRTLQNMVPAWQPQQQLQQQQKNWGGQTVIPAATAVTARPVQTADANAAFPRRNQDRSRTPVARGPQPPAGPPKGKKPPPPWEEHWSDEYQIPYYWNPDTGESAWENPG